MTTWAMEEFAGAKLGDQRLTQRLISESAPEYIYSLAAAQGLAS